MSVENFRDELLMRVIREYTSTGKQPTELRLTHDELMRLRLDARPYDMKFNFKGEEETCFGLPIKIAEGKANDPQP